MDWEFLGLPALFYVFVFAAVGVAFLARAVLMRLRKVMRQEDDRSSPPN